MIHITTFFFHFLAIFFLLLFVYLAEFHVINTKTQRGTSNQIQCTSFHRLGTATPKANHHIETATVHKDTPVADSDTKPQ